MLLTGRNRTDSAIPTSSMADIAFLLIIFFMVTSVFSATKGLEMLLPAEEKEAEGQKPDEAVFIHVLPGEVLVDCRAMEVDQILPYLEPKLTRNPNKPVILYTHPDAEYGRMIEVFDLLAGTGDGGNDSAFAVKNLFDPTKTDIENYIETFGVNPLETACM